MSNGTRRRNQGHHRNRKDHEEPEKTRRVKFDYWEDFTLPEDRTPEQRKKIDDACDVLEQLRRPYLRRPGVVAIDVGYPYSQKEDRFKDEVAIRVHVERKLDSVRLKEEGIPSFSTQEGAYVAGLEFEEYQETEEGEKSKKAPPKTWVLVNGFRIDVIEARYDPSGEEIQALRPRPNDGSFGDSELLRLAQRAVSPLVGGLSIGNGQGPAGTVGAVVWDRTDGTPCLLSNWHVLAGSVRATVGQPCFQPAIFDGGEKTSDAVATLKRWIFDKHGDAALAQISPEHDYCVGEILGLRYPVFDCIEPELGMKVRKWGRTTGFTRGFIDGIKLSVVLDYRAAGVQRFDDQLHIVPRFRGDEVSAPGDSGAVWVHNSKNDHVDVEHYYAVGLHFAGDVPGSALGEYAIASSIDKLSKQLEFAARPVFVPPEGFVVQGRRHRNRGEGTRRRLGPAARPEGLGADDRPGGPQPTPEPVTGGGGG